MKVEPDAFFTGNGRNHGLILGVVESQWKVLNKGMI